MEHHAHMVFSVACMSFHRSCASCICLVDVSMSVVFSLVDWMPSHTCKPLWIIIFCCYIHWCGLWVFKCRCYIKLFDSTSKSTAEEDDEMSKLPPSQRKKMKQKQKKAEARAKKVC